jgi:protein-S-isoprenylcysteine O-methyltransferase Ste14
MNRILPPTLVLITLMGMILLNWLMPITVLFPAPYNWLGILPLALGIALLLAADRTFKMVRTNVNTFKEPDRLVTHGLFRYSRNPMYLGFLLILAGVWILLASATPVLGVIGFFLVADRHYISFEERMLTGKFGGQFEAYTLKTRRWI